MATRAIVEAGKAPATGSYTLCYKYRTANWFNLDKDILVEPETLVWGKHLPFDRNVDLMFCLASRSCLRWLRVLHHCSVRCHAHSLDNDDTSEDGASLAVGLVIFLVIFGLLLCVGGTVLWYYLWSKHNEKLEDLRQQKAAATREEVVVCVIFVAKIGSIHLFSGWSSGHTRLTFIQSAKLTTSKLHGRLFANA